jgi:hypothetical protein
MKWVKVLLIIAISIYLLLLLGLYFFQESMIFMDSKLSKEYQFRFENSFEEVNLTAQDGAVLNGVHFKLEKPKGVILYFHGNAEDISRWGTIVQPFLDFNYEVLLVDYRGYGKSGGKRTSKKLYQDAIDWYAYAKGLRNQDEIIVYGRSIGCTFATYVAANASPKKLILETPFYSLKSIVDDRFPFLPTSILLRFQLPTYKFIGDSQCPIVFIHGTEDQVVPYENGLRLFEKAKNASLVTIEGGEHNNLANFEEYWQAIETHLSN